ncbi:hypothetical protein RB614_20350 [Phytohabitans sp. ZYX-F-186]|uniref:Uncharacterized protein n=1 Tax=Phytohabitans maris TaxID=3071409 RepID=A0ABU0ZII9_9ACTN|nr:hypothetical protein [Phytohabitans sp. ZYX-F-186]MDQ7906870.1 hypothetical protein [Phytohabitans sp. ZYX-F-186]
MTDVDAVAREETRLIPRTDIDLDSALPGAATFWMPARDEIHDEGIGFFRGVWAIFDVPLSEAAVVVADERAAAAAVDAVATDAESFEDFARVIEGHNPDFPSEEPEDEADMATLAEHGDVDSVSLCGLDLGVAGLTYALAATGCVPAASCRSHAERSWSDRPVVLAAIDREHAQWLQPLVQRSSCGFGIDDERPEFLVIHARSITEMMDLAAAILAKAEQDPPPPLRWGPSSDDDDPMVDDEPQESVTEVDGQQSLFD